MGDCFETSYKVCDRTRSAQRYGGKSAAWLWRIIRNEKDFPSPLVLGGRYFFPLEELDAFDAKHRRSDSRRPTSGPKPKHQQEETNGANKRA